MTEFPQGGERWSSASASELKDEALRLGDWFHQIELTPGVRTRDLAPSPGPQPVDHPRQRWDVIREELPADLSGQRVLDIGCAEGFFAIEMARRGATVVAVDAARSRVEKLRFAAAALGLDAEIETHVAPVESLPSLGLGRFDAVLMIALLYHLRHPLLGLEIVAETTDQLWLETAGVADDDRPYLYYEPPNPAHPARDKWMPTTACVEAMLRSVGFDEIVEIDRVPTSGPGCRVYYRAQRSGTTA